MSDSSADQVGLSRRTMLRLGAVGGVGVGVTAAGAFGRPYLSQKGLLSPDGAFGATSTALGDLLFYKEVFPTSPLILSPFSDPLVIPPAASPVPASVYTDRKKWPRPPGPGVNQQNSLGNVDGQHGIAPGNETHQLWPTDPLIGQKTDPLVYKIDVKVAQHSFTTSQVMAIDSLGQPSVSFDASGQVAAGTKRSLPPSTIYGFNSTFPGPRINAEYGRACLVRFENHLGDDNGFQRQDFGAPNYSFLTHHHNGHTAPESDGNPHYGHHRFSPFGRYTQEAAFEPGEWIDQMYLTYPAGGDEREKQSFFWFHDHVHGHTGANVYKGMVGLMPLYDPIMDSGDETKGFRLPGVRRDYAPGWFDVDYDIPLAFYDCRLDDGLTPHKDAHNGNGETHPEWWGKTYFRHFPNHGFVGDIFTVNGTAYPVMEVKRRKYR